MLFCRILEGSVPCRQIVETSLVHLEKEVLKKIIDRHGVAGELQTGASLGALTIFHTQPKTDIYK